MMRDNASGRRSSAESQSGMGLATLPASKTLHAKGSPMLIAANKAVSIDYTLTNDAGEVIDTSVGGAPLGYLNGAAMLRGGLERALAGRRAGAAVGVTGEPEEAYGECSAELVAVLNRYMFEGVDELAVGMQFHASGPGGGMQIVTSRD